MSQFFVNKGYNRNLYVQLSGGGRRYQIDVYVVAAFVFQYSPAARNWTTTETNIWKRRFANLVYNTWSEKWDLRSDISCNLIDVERGRISMPTARVRVHVLDSEAHSVRLATNQHLSIINVYRQASGERQERQRANALETSSVTVSNLEEMNIHAPNPNERHIPSGVTQGHLYDGSLESSGNDRDDNTQIVAMHEFGHMLGLMHPNHGQGGCQQDTNANICYGQSYSPESASIMGRGQQVRPQEYRVFVQIISQLVSTVLSPSSISLFSNRFQLHWFVEGTHDNYCRGRLSSIENNDIDVRGMRRGSTYRGPVGLG